jgi:hypothetical protein
MDFWTLPRFLSALVVLGYMVLALHFRDGACAAKLFLYCLLPIFCIWFPDAMGRYRGVGVAFPQKVTDESPPSIVFMLGWVLLLLPALIVLLMLCGCIAT